MIIQKLTKVKDTTYEVEIGNTSHQFEENTILKYRLFEGKEIDEKTLNDCLLENNLETIKKKAYFYHLKYLKNRYEVIHYLLEKDIPLEVAQRALNELEELKQIDDLKLCKWVASSLARASNGIPLIQYKLKGRHFQEQDISLAIESIADEDIEEGREKLLRKSSKKYAKLPEFERKQKLKELFYRHGYNEV